MCASTGFARVTEALIPYFLERYELVILGCNYHGDPTPYPFKIYPATNKFQTAPFGEERLREVVLKENPDIIFTINDIWIVNDQYSRIRDLHKEGKFKFIAYTPVDGNNWFDLFETANQFDQLISYTHFGAIEAKNAGYRNHDGKSLAPVVYHGVDTEQFYPILQEEARKNIGIPDDKFIVFNGNRNQPRKRIDITIKAFSEFAVGREDTLLYLHMGTKDMGWSVMPLFKKEMEKRGLNPGGRLILTSGDSPQLQSVPIEMLNMIYNVADVGLNSCTGEGFGLVNMEHAACGVPQLVPGHTACRELFEGYGDLIPIEHVESDKDFGRDMYGVSVRGLTELLIKYYDDPDYRAEKGKSCYRRATMPEFQWSNICQQFIGVIDEVINRQPEQAIADDGKGFTPVRSISLSKKAKKGKRKKEEVVFS